MDAVARAGFEAAIVENPQERANWQAYADWLSEQGDPHGELMQVQLALEEEGLEAKQRKRLEERFGEILKEHQDAILGPGAQAILQLAGKFGWRAADGAMHLDPGPYANWWHAMEFRRGWLHRVILDGPGDVPGLSLSQMPAARLLQELELIHVDANAQQTIAPVPFLGSLRRFCWWDLIFDAEIEALCRQMPRLEALGCIGWNPHIATVVRELPQLSSLKIAPYPVDINDAFTNAPELSKITQLELLGNNLQLDRLLQSPHLVNVRRLTLFGDALNVPALRASGILGQLASLTVEGGVFQDAAAGDALTELAAQPGLHLRLKDVGMPVEVENRVRAAAPTTEITAVRAATVVDVTGYLFLVLLGIILFAIYSVWSWNQKAPLIEVPAFHIAGGMVTAGGQPLAGALVRVAGTQNETETNAQGHFGLIVSAPFTGTITAWKAGYLIGAARETPAGLAIDLEPLPAKDHPGYAWVAPHPDPAHEHQCGNCHPHIYDEWQASGHSRAAINPRLANLLAGTNASGEAGHGWNLLAEYPEGAGVCTSCHAPTVRADHPAALDLRKAAGVDRDGVHCDLCHKIAGAVPDAKMGISHGIYGLDLLRPEKGQLFFGPWDDVARGEDAFSPLYHESRYCASCHEGTLFGVPVYTTYSEWLASPARQAGKQCQDCHMASTGSHTNVAPGHGGLERRAETLSRHDFPGGTPEMLAKAVKLETELEQNAAGRKLTCVLAADAGHKVPTGFIDRQLLLVVETLDAKGEPLTISEPRLPPRAGSFAGSGGKLFARQYLAADGQPIPFWRAGGELTDTRLVPGQPERVEFPLSAGTAKVRVRLVYRRFWQEVERAKDWPASDVTLVDRTIELK